MKILNPKKYIMLLGVAHLLVDALCIGVLFSLKYVDNFGQNQYFTGIVLYNLIAFGTQPIFGFIGDQTRRPKWLAIIGMMTVILGAMTSGVAIVSIIFLGLGNSMFHVGGGIISLRTAYKKAAMPGLFVGPGAIGVFLANYIQGQLIYVIIVVFLMSGLALLLLVLPVEQVLVTKEEVPTINQKSVAIIIMLLFVICVRAIIGGGLDFTWKTTINMKVLALSAVVLGKGLGGFIGDRFGFTKTAAGGLLGASLLLTFGMNSWYLSIVGLFLFNLTMPITLTVLAYVFRQYKGFAFGLTTLALVVGYMINKVFGSLYEGSQLTVFLLIILSAVCVFIGIKGAKI